MSPPTHLHSSLVRLQSTLSGAHPLLACFDYDGTLADIAPRPELATPSPTVVAALTALGQKRATEVALVSGRSMTDLAGLIALPGVWYIGSHGLELRSPAGELLSPTAEERAQIGRKLQPLRDQVPKLCARHERVWVEDKKLALALHTRAASSSTSRRAMEAFRALVEEYTPDYEVITGKEVIEVRSRTGNKGSAVLDLVHRVEPSLVLYVGDDTTDEDAFHALQGLSAITVRVTREPANAETSAQYFLRDPEEVASFLELLTGWR